MADPLRGQKLLQRKKKPFSNFVQIDELHAHEWLI